MLTHFPHRCLIAPVPTVLDCVIYQIPKLRSPGDLVLSLLSQLEGECLHHLGCISCTLRCTLRCVRPVWYAFGAVCGSALLGGHGSWVEKGWKSRSATAFDKHLAGKTFFLGSRCRSVCACACLVAQLAPQPCRVPCSRADALPRPTQS